MYGKIRLKVYLLTTQASLHFLTKLDYRGGLRLSQNYAQLGLWGRCELPNGVWDFSRFYAFIGLKYQIIFAECQKYAQISPSDFLYIYFTERVAFIKIRTVQGRVYPAGTSWSNDVETMLYKRYIR